MRFLSVRQEKSIPLNQQFTFTELKKRFICVLFLSKNLKVTFAKPALIQIFHFEFSFNFTPLIFFCNVLTFVVQFFTTGKTDFYFDQITFDINFQWYQRVAFFCNLSCQFVNLIFMKQKFLWT